MTDEPKPSSEFAEWLASQLRHRGLDGRHLARLSGIGRDVIAGYLTAKTLPSPQYRAKLAAVLDVPEAKIDELVIASARGVKPPH